MIPASVPASNSSLPAAAGTAESSGRSALPLMARAARFGDRVALIDVEGEMSYGQLLDRAERMAARLLGGQRDLDGARIAFLAAPGRNYVTVQWGIWLAGGIAVPLCITHPRAEQEYVVTDSDASAVVGGPGFAEAATGLAAARSARFVDLNNIEAEARRPLPVVEGLRGALILYTSGTTGKPKGVVLTHDNLEAQVVSLVTAWGWSENDRILHVLPLHHLHGIVNVLTCALWAGAVCQFLPRFDAAAVWRVLERRELSLFMAVPSIYQRLIQAWEDADEATRARWSESCSHLRLMVSGSAALPIPVLEKWRTISGHTLLERYGMTEIGMGLSNPLHGERVPGAVGSPLPGVEVRLVDDAGREVLEDETPGQIEVRGPTVFRQYWRRPDETASAFSGDWFRTGDVGVRNKGVYRILGRSSVDIIKTGGYKVSALEIEQVLLGHPEILECAVVGVADEEWGERVCAAIRWRGSVQLSMDELRAWAREQLAIYKVPSRVLRVDSLPRNAMGKVIKKEVAQLFTPREAPAS